MKKNKTKITTLLGSSAVAGGIAIAAIAQTCGGTDQRNVQQDITSIVNSINQLSNYDVTMGQSPVLDSLANEMLSSLNTSLLPLNSPSGTTFTVETLGSIAATSTLVSQDTGGASYTLSNLPLMGTGVLSDNQDDFYTITGSLTLVINVVNGSLSAGTATQITANNVEETIVNGVNVLSTYTGETIISNIIAQAVLSSIEIALPTGFTLNSLVFSNITTSSITPGDNRYVVAISNVGILGTSSNGDISTSFDNVSFTLTETNRQFTVGTTTLTSPVSVEQTIINGINELSNYAAGSNPTTELGMDFLASINSVLNGTLESLTFTMITSSNISIDPQAGIVVRTNATGTATGDLVNVSGMANIAITIDSSTGMLIIAPNGVTGLNQTSAEIGVIVIAVNSLNGYTSNTSSPSPLSTLIIERLGTATNNGSENFTFGRIENNAFNVASVSDITELNATTWNVAITARGPSVVIGQALNGRDIRVINAEIILRITENGGIFQVELASSNLGRLMPESTVLSGLIDDMNNRGIREFNIGSILDNPRILAAANAIAAGFVAAPAGGVNITVLDWSYNALTIFDVTRTNGSYTVLFPNIMGDATENGGQSNPYTLSGDRGPSMNGITVVFSGSNASSPGDVQGCQAVITT